MIVRAILSRTLLLAAITVLFVSSGNAQSFEPGNCLKIDNVERWDFLNIRARPDHRSEITGAIAPNTGNPIVVTGRCTPQTANLRRLWCPIVYFATKEVRLEGYVKMYFTELIECPPSVEYYQNRPKD